MLVPIKLYQDSNSLVYPKYLQVWGPFPPCPVVPKPVQWSFSKLIDMPFFIIWAEPSLHISFVSHKLSPNEMTDFCFVLWLFKLHFLWVLMPKHPHTAQFFLQVWALLQYEAHWILNPPYICGLGSCVLPN